MILQLCFYAKPTTKEDVFMPNINLKLKGKGKNLQLLFGNRTVHYSKFAHLIVLLIYTVSQIA